jgi:uncharacterized membrane-anchored protein YhcB (DUF1043 family)
MNEVYEMNEILTTFGSFIIGIIVGFAIYHFAIGKSKVSTQQKEIDKTKSELEEYKAKVNSHFNNTAELMGEVASSYQSLYNHMADQSQDLLSDADLTPFPLLEKTPIESEETVQADNSEQEIASVEAEAIEDINEADKQGEEGQVNDYDNVPIESDVAESDSKKETASDSAEASDDVKDVSETIAEITADTDEKIADSIEEFTDISKDESTKKTI